jgi:hypothetical protein
VLASALDDPSDGADVMVTLRLPYELDKPFMRAHAAATDLINAGVIFFHTSPETSRFAEPWWHLSDELGSDQWALNRLLAPGDLSALGRVELHSGVRVSYLSSRETGRQPVSPRRWLLIGREVLAAYGVLPGRRIAADPAAAAGHPHRSLAMARGAPPPGPGLARPLQHRDHTALRPPDTGRRPGAHRRSRGHHHRRPCNQVQTDQAAISK